MGTKTIDSAEAWGAEAADLRIGQVYDMFAAERVFDEASEQIEAWTKAPVDGLSLADVRARLASYIV